MSSSLTATKIKDTYGQLLHVDGWVNGTPKTVYDGDGTATALKVSTTSLAIETNLIVTLGDQSTKEYTDAESYLDDWPDREADVIAMGWFIK